MTMTTERKSNRTALYERGRHVGTILEQEKSRPGKPGHYAWYTTGQAGFASTYEGAMTAIIEELQR
ncbi:hypothetical protein LCGC14_2373520 [marine sediment metagenome]|uniref:Uncharacterized protein n=1 Tax=marine sediment metagenome TaxID=412755 RepID=A0A0F9CQA3_9ZZZZ